MWWWPVSTVHRAFSYVHVLSSDKEFVFFQMFAVCCSTIHQLQLLNALTIVLTVCQSIRFISDEFQRIYQVLDYNIRQDPDNTCRTSSQTRMFVFESEPYSIEQRSLFKMCAIFLAGHMLCLLRVLFSTAPLFCQRATWCYFWEELILTS